MENKWLATLVISVLTLIGLWPAKPAIALNNTYYIDCSAGVDGDGSMGSPWNTPQSLYDHQRPPGPYTFGGGDQILVKRGTTCTYPVRLIRGRGVPGNPITISTYGNPGDARPIINGSGVEVDNWDGQAISSAVQVYDADNLIIDDLELTNTGGDPLDGRRQGIQLFAVERYGAHENITVSNNYIHDIEGEYKKNHEATAGILVEQRLPPPVIDPNPTATWFDNLLIEDNVIENTNRQGINLWGDWRNRVEDGYDPTGPAWTAWTNVVIQNNTINHVRGDGILVTNADGAQISGNTVDGFNELNGLDEPTIQTILSEAQTKQSLASLPSRRHAGVWTYNADNTVIEHNDVRGGVSNEDGMAYDIDGGSINTTIQYNYSQDNDGGWLLICNELGKITGGIVRYNISKDDSFASITTCVGEVLTTEVYNNTIYSTDSVTYPWRQVDWLRFGGDPMNDIRDITITNNILTYPDQNIPAFFYNEREGSGVIVDQVATDTVADNNLFYGVSTPSKDSSSLSGRPRFYDTSQTAAGFMLRSNSPAYTGGAVVAGNGGLDYFGNALSAPFNVGADESEPPQTAMWFVTPPNDNRLQFIRVSDETDASTGLEEPSGPGTEELAVEIDSGSLHRRLAEFSLDLTDDRDFSAAKFDFDAEIGGVLVHNLASVVGVVGGTYDLLVPKADSQSTIGVCPGASSLTDLSTDCSGYYVLDVPADVNQVKINGIDYYQIDGLSGTAAFYPGLLGLANTGSNISLQSSFGLLLAILALTSLGLKGRIYQHILIQERLHINTY